MSIPIRHFQKILLLDRHGFFPKANEPLEDFIQSGPSTFNDTSTPVTHPPELVSCFWMRFSLDIRSLPVEISKTGILPWEPACCWIDQEGKSLIRLKPPKKNSIVSKNAVLTHEYVHALRGRLFSNHYEEMCAYTASAELFPKDFPKWRTWLSPLFSSTKEFLFTFFWMIGCWILPFALNEEISPFFVFGLSLLPLIGYTLRLNRRWKKWNKTRKLLTFINEKNALALLLRLSDADIDWVAEQSVENFQEALNEQASKDWRWFFFKETFLT